MKNKNKDLTVKEFSAFLKKYFDGYSPDIHFISEDVIRVNDCFFSPKQIKEAIDNKTDSNVFFDNYYKEEEKHMEEHGGDKNL